MNDRRVQAALRQQESEYASNFVATNDELQWLTDRASRPDVLTAAEKLLRDQSPARRILGARILSGAKEALALVGPSLVAALAAESDDDATLWELAAISRLQYRDALPAVLELAQHPHAEIRYKVATAITGCGWPDPPEEATRALIKLTDDIDQDVRFSAIFELSSWWMNGFRAPHVLSTLKRHQFDLDHRAVAAIAEAFG